MKTMHLPAWIFWIAVSTFAGLASAQSFEQQLKAGAKLAPDLTYPAEAKALSFISPLEMAIYKPEGAGPFPAVVLLHSCGGLRSEIRDWTNAAIEAGYVAFVLDSLGPRGLKTNCFPPSTVYPSRGVKDAFQALDHLKSFPFVDSSRVGFIGFSWGATVGLLVSASEGARALSDGKRFGAVVSLYPMCNFTGTSRIPNAVEYLRPDTDKPLLVLMGDQDTETPPSECIPRLDALKKKGAPVEWNLYPGATHCWDCAAVANQSKTDFQGNRVAYHYSKEITDDSKKRAFDFLGKNLDALKQ
jgi:dienelactone hydrolase